MKYNMQGHYDLKHRFIFPRNPSRLYYFALKPDLEIVKYMDSFFFLVNFVFGQHICFLLKNSHPVNIKSKTLTYQQPMKKHKQTVTQKQRKLFSAVQSYFQD